MVKQFTLSDCYVNCFYKKFYSYYILSGFFVNYFTKSIVHSLHFDFILSILSYLIAGFFCFLFWFYWDSLHTNLNSHQKAWSKKEEDKEKKTRVKRRCGISHPCSMCSTYWAITGDTHFDIVFNNRYTGWRPNVIVAKMFCKLPSIC